MIMRAALAASLALGVLAAPLAAEAQAAGKVHRLGALFFGAPSDPTVGFDPFLQTLRGFGWVDGQSILIERRYAEGKSERLPDLAAELVRLPVDVLLAFGTDSAVAAKNATRTLPIVMAAGADPVEKGLVLSLGRPGGNITGVTFMSPQLSGKRLELLKEAVPGISRVSVLWDPTYSDQDFRALQIAARALGISLQSLEVRSLADFDSAFRTAVTGRAEALVVTTVRVTALHRKRIQNLAAENRLPTVSSWRAFAEAGALITYGPNVADMFRRAAVHVDRILKGAKPADLPVEQPTTFEFIINLKTAKALGLTIPPSVLLRADHVIE